MRALRYRAGWRHLLRHPAQLTLLVLGVALGVAVVVSIDLAIGAARRAFQLSTETVAGRATHQVVAGPGGIPDTVVRAIRVDAGVRTAAPVVEGFVESEALPGLPLRVLGVDPFADGAVRDYAAVGAGVDLGALLTRRGAALLLDGTARRAGVPLGGRLPVRTSGSVDTLTVVGVLRPAGAAERAGLADVVLMDVARAQDLLGRAGVDRIDLALPDGRAGEEALAAVRRLLPASARVEARGTRTRTMQAMLGAFDLNLRALSLLALVFGMFLIYNAMNFAVLQRRELYGTLRTLGVTRREVAAGVVGEALGVALLGSALGLALGTALGRGLVRLVTRTINDLYFVVSVQDTAPDPVVWVRGAALGVAATLLATLPALRAALRQPPRRVLLRSEVEGSATRWLARGAVLGGVLMAVGAGLLALTRRSVAASFATLFLMIGGMALLTPLATAVLADGLRPLIRGMAGTVGALAVRGVRASMSRTAPAAAALVVAVSVTVGLGIMIQSFRGSLERWLDATLQADLYLSLPSSVRSRPVGTLPPPVLEVVRRHPAVTGVHRYRGAEVMASGGPVRLLAVDPPGEALTGVDLLEGDPAVLRTLGDGSDVLVSEPLAFRRGLEVGDRVELFTDEGRRPFRVSGVFRDYASDQGTVLMHRRVYDTYWNDPGVTSVALELADEADPNEVARELQAAVARAGVAVTVRPNRALREGSLQVFDRTFQVTVVLRMLAFLVAFIGVVGALMALQLERTREVAVLRATGFTPAQVWGLVTAQTGLLGLLAGLLAVPVGLVLAVVMIQVVNRRSFGWTLSMDVGGDVLLQAVGLALAGALLAGIFPAWRMARTPPALALRNE